MRCAGVLWVCAVGAGKALLLPFWARKQVESIHTAPVVEGSNVRCHCVAVEARLVVTGGAGCLVAVMPK